MGCYTNTPAALAPPPRLGLPLGQVHRRHGEEEDEEEHSSSRRPGHHGRRQPNGLGRIRGPSF